MRQLAPAVPTDPSPADVVVLGQLRRRGGSVDDDEVTASARPALERMLGRGWVTFDPPTAREAARWRLTGEGTAAWDGERRAA